MSYYAKRFFGQQKGIVTDGLKLWLDASNPVSYPGSGTTWFDLSGSGNNGTLVNGVAFSTANGGVMSFDGVNDTVTLPSTEVFLNTAQPFTLSAWVRLSAFNNLYPNIFSLRTNIDSVFVGVSHYAPYLGFLFGSNSGFYRGRTNTPTTFFVGNWVNVVLVYNGLGATTAANFKAYLNSIDTAHSNAGTFANPPNTMNRIGYRTDNSQSFNGLINDANIYDYALTPQQIEANYNATKSKYGL